MIRDVLEASLRSALESVGIEPPATIVLERPARREHGDWSSNVALATGKKAGRNPRELASRAGRGAHQGPAARTSPRVEVAGPGFVNFHLAPTWLHDVLTEVVAQGEADYARLDFGDRRAGAGRVRLGQPDGADPRRQRLVRLLRRLAGPAAHPLRLRGQPRVLRQRHRRADPPARRVGAGPAGGRAHPRGRLPQRLRQGPGQRLRRPRRHHRGRPVGRRAHPRLHPGPDGRGPHRTTTSGSARPPSRRARPSPRPSPQLQETGLVWEEDGALWLDTAAARRPPREAGAAQVARPGRRLHLPGRRHRLPPQQVPRPRASTGSSTCGAPTTRARWPACRPGVAALGVDKDRLEVRIGQMVSLASGRIGKRLGNAVDLDDLVDDIGPDVMRLLSLVASIDQSPTIDLDKVRSRVPRVARVLRAVRPRPHPLDREEGERAGRQPGRPRRRSTCRRSPTSARSSCCARCRPCPRWSSWRATSGRRTR